MPETGGLGQLVALLTDPGGANTRLGRGCVLLGVVTFIGGVVFLAMAETVRMTAEDLRTYRGVAGVLVGVALPAFLYGVILLADEVRGPGDKSEIGILLCGLAAIIFGATGVQTPYYAGLVLFVYGSGVLFCARTARNAISTGGPTITPDDHTPASPDETAFIWEDSTGELRDVLASDAEFDD